MTQLERGSFVDGVTEREVLLQTQVGLVQEAHGLLVYYLENSDSPAPPLILPETGRTVGPTILTSWRDKLNPLREELRLRMVRMLTDHIPPNELALRYITGQLVNTVPDLPKGRIIREDVEGVILQLKSFQEEREHGLVASEDERRRQMERERAASLGHILPTLLDELAGEFTYVESGSVPDQLNDFVCSSGKGIYIPSDRLERSLATVQNIFSTLEALKYPETGEILYEWILNKMCTEDYNDCITALGILAQTIFMLDEASLYQLYSAGNNDGQILYNPVRQLYRGVREAENLLKNTASCQEYAPVMASIAQVIYARYSQIVSSLPELTQPYETGKLPLPKTDALYQLFFNRSCRCQLLHGLPLEEAAFYVVRYLQQLKVDAEYVRQFCQSWEQEIEEEKTLLTEKERERNRALKFAFSAIIAREAVRVRLLPDEKNAVALEELEKMKEYPWQDAATLLQTNTNEIIPEGTERVVLTIWTATIGPAHPGHAHAIWEMADFMEQQEISEAQARQAGSEVPKTRYLLLILPITDPQELEKAGEKWHKNVAVRGQINDRLASLLLQLPPDLVDQFRVLVTTQLAATPGEARSVVNAIKTAYNEFTSLANAAIKEKGRLANINWVLRAAAGADELQFSTKRQRPVLSDVQPKKFSALEHWLLVGRHGYLLALINAIESLTARGLNPSLILTPGLPFSSTQEIENLKRGNPGDYGVLANLFVEGPWSRKAIDKRAARSKREASRKKAPPQERRPKDYDTAEIFQEALKIVEAKLRVER